MAIESRVVTVGGSDGSMPLDPDVTMAANSDKSIASQKAVKGYVDALRTSQVFTQALAGARVGATAGWVITGTNSGLIRVPASQTASTLVVPVSIPLKVGATILAYSVVAQVESAGGAVTLDVALWKSTNAAGDATEADIGSITQVAVTADAAVASSKTLAAPEVVAAGENFYFLVTATTAGSTDIALQGFTLTVTGV